MKRKAAPMQQAVAHLFEIGTTVATPQQILETANKFDVEVWRLEGFYLDAVEDCSES
jgi:hypothetical protein